MNSGYPSLTQKKNVSCVNFIFSKNIVKIQKLKNINVLHTVKFAEFSFSKKYTFSMLVAEHKMVF
jgi:hypothetical protein